MIDRKKYSQVLIIGNSVEERDGQQLETLFNTTHKIGDWEMEALFKGKPEIILIGTGQKGMLEVNKNLLNKAQKGGIKVIVDISPKIVEIYNEKIKFGNRVNALIHTTC